MPHAPVLKRGAQRTVCPPAFERQCFPVYACVFCRRRFLQALCPVMRCRFRRAALKKIQPHQRKRSLMRPSVPAIFRPFTPFLKERPFSHNVGLLARAFRGAVSEKTPAKRTPAPAAPPSQENFPSDRVAPRAANSCAYSFGKSPGLDPASRAVLPGFLIAAPAVF